MTDAELENAHKGIDLLQKTSGAGLNTMQLPMEYGRPMLNYIYALEKDKQALATRIKDLEAQLATTSEVAQLQIERATSGRLTVGQLPTSYEVKLDCNLQPVGDK